MLSSPKSHSSSWKPLPTAVSKLVPAVVQLRDESHIDRPQKSTSQNCISNQQSSSTSNKFNYS